MINVDKDIDTIFGLFECLGFVDPKIMSITVLIVLSLGNTDIIAIFYWDTSRMYSFYPASKGRKRNM